MTCLRFYKERMEDASNFQFILVGNIKKEVAKKMVCRYLATCHSNYKKEYFVDHHIRFPDHNIEKVVPLKIETPRESHVVCYHYDIKNKPINDLYMQVIQSR
ncbi:hypothetical protein K4L44_00315 [Halosquirtibacter laminarini]|uniref:Uncharacterized protein n=1 Tax=Halosquirtibacter laminarini TaxID=3374600 RepID=A0AC61NFI4_9BACT|nr:hypothetical protein K4L44_00315 [Prolixibacteraceae bacterium]